MSTRRPRSRSAGPETRSARYIQRRNDVIDAAAHMFAVQGYHATTIDDLVEASNLQRGGLYHYIGSKQDVLLSIHERFIEPLLEETRAIAASAEPADVRLREIARALMRTIDRYHDQVTVFLHEWRVIATDPRWSAIRDRRREFERQIEIVLERGCEEGIFVVEDVRLTTLAFLGMFNYSYQWFDRRGRASAESIADAFFTLFVSGIARDRS